MDRYVMHLVHTISDGRWHLKHEDSALGSFETKAQAEDAGREHGKSLWSEGKPAQLVVHRKDGSIEHEYTYGKDPGRHVG